MHATRRSPSRLPRVQRSVRDGRAMSEVPDQGPLAGRLPLRRLRSWSRLHAADPPRLRGRGLPEAPRQQPSLLAGTIFEQTKTALARWFLAIYLVTSSKGGIAAAELQRQLGLGSYQTAWSWLHKLRKAMVRPDGEPLAGRVEADETYVGG